MIVFKSESAFCYLSVTGLALVLVFTRVCSSHPVKCGGGVFPILQICDQMINLNEL